MFVDCMHRVPSRCCNIAYKHSTKCNSVSLNVQVWDAATSGTKCNAIQMRPNVARRFSDFATNSRAVTSMSMLYTCSLSLCTCRTARWLSCCWLIELRMCVFRQRSDEKLRSASALLHGIVSRSRTSCSTWSNILWTINWLSWCELCSDVIHRLHLPVLLSHLASCMASPSASTSGYADMTVFNSSVFVSAAIKMFSSCMYECSPGWSYLSFSWVTAVSTTWKNRLRKYSSGVVQACAGAGPQSRSGPASRIPISSRVSLSTPMHCSCRAGHEVFTVALHNMQITFAMPHLDRCNTPCHKELMRGTRYKEWFKIILHWRILHAHTESLSWPKSWGDQYIAGPPTQKLGDLSSPVPVVVAPMLHHDRPALERLSNHNSCAMRYRKYSETKTKLRIINFELSATQYSLTTGIF